MIFSLKLYHHYFKIEVKRYSEQSVVKVYYFIQGTLDNFFSRNYIYLRAFFLVIETNVYQIFSHVYIGGEGTVPQLF